MTPLSRRSLLGALGVSVLLAGCQTPWSSTDGSSGGARPTRTGTASATSRDVDLAREALAEVLSMQTLLAGSELRESAPRLVARFETLHRAHLKALQGVAPTTSAAAPSSPTPGTTAPGTSTATGRTEAVRRRILARETRHLVALDRLAGQAESGTFARLLAAMSTAVAQNLRAVAPGHALPPGPQRAPQLAAGTADTDPGLVAVQQALAAQHAALYTGAVLAARTSASAQPTLRSALSERWTEHRELRDQVEAMLRTAGEAPVAADPGYVMPGGSDSPAQVKQTAALVETRCTEAWSALVGHTEPGELRTWAMAQQRESAVRELVFGGNPVAFPGAVQLTNR